MTCPGLARRRAVQHLREMLGARRDARELRKDARDFLQLEGERKRDEATALRRRVMRLQEHARPIGQVFETASAPSVAQAISGPAAAQSARKNSKRSSRRLGHAAVRQAPVLAIAELRGEQPRPERGMADRFAR